MCGVIIRLGIPNRGLSDSIGSLLTTSMAAPASLPLLRAAARSVSFMSDPRAVLIRYAPSLSFEMNSRSMKPVF